MKGMGIKKIILCADDYSLNGSTSEGILLLAAQRRINAISCLVTSPDWSENAKRLGSVRKHCYLGLHLNLTEDGGKKLSTLIRQAYLGRLNQSLIEGEIAGQVEAFTQALDRWPDFIDGHQHVHQLPIIREALLAVYKQKKLTSFCRSTSNGWRDFLARPKQLIISQLGGARFKKRLKQEAIKTNSSFACCYPFAKAKHYRYYFKLFFKASHSGLLIICHPGLPSQYLVDAL